MNADLHMAEQDVDTGDIPEVIDWRNAERGKFYRPVKQQITLRDRRRPDRLVQVPGQQVPDLHQRDVARLRGTPQLARLRLTDQ